MNRTITFLAASACAAIAVTSACFAHGAEDDADFGRSDRDIAFRLEPARQANELQLSLRSGSDRDRNHMSSHFKASELVGLDLAHFRSTANGPVQFALVREAGRVDCAGNGGNASASGNCHFQANAAFADLLASRGIARPNAKQSYTLTLVGADRKLVDAIHAARYPVPSIDELAGLAAVGVTPAYIGELSRRGYRPSDLDDLTGFKALDISPAYIDAMSRAGYGKLKASDIMAFKAVGVSPDYVAGMARIGYKNLGADDIVQLKALDVTPEFVSGFEQLGYRGLPAQKLVELKALNVTPEFVRSIRQDGVRGLSADQLVKLKVAGMLDDRD